MKGYAHMTEKEAVDVIESSLLGTEGIPVQLRSGQGLNKQAVSRLCNAIRFLSKRWREQQEVPKKVAAAFVDIQSTMQVGSAHYNEKELEEIEDAANELVDLAFELFEIPEEQPGAGGERQQDAALLFRFIPRSAVAGLPPGSVVYDVSSRAPLPFTKLSPFYPHGGIPVPGMPGTTSDSVEGVWQGLKVLNGQIDASFFKGKGKKRRGRPEGHKLGEELLGYVDARQKIYVPTYEYMWRECVGHDLRRYFFDKARQGIVQYFHDFEDNGNVDEPSAPLAHSSILVRLLAEDFARDSR